MSWQRIAASAEDTREAGALFASVLRPGDVVLLEGGLGAGKTTFVQGVARALGVNERVTSPTFTVVRQHQCANSAGISTLHHADIYRVEQMGEIIDLALGELVEESAVALVEWGELAGDLFGANVLRVAIGANDDESRTIRVTNGSVVARDKDLERWSVT